MADATKTQVPTADATVSTRQDPEAPSDELPRSGRRRRRLVMAGVGVAVAAVAAVAAVLVSGRGGDSTATPTAALTTAVVGRRTVVQSERVDATLDYGTTRSVSSVSSGTLTGVAGAGSTVGRGGQLFEVDQHPTVLLVGSVPMYRDLAAGVGDGIDVKELEENLAALGFTDGGALTVDEHFDLATTAAVEAWQDSLGLDATGTVTRADVVFLPGVMRVADDKLDPGAAVQRGTPVLETTSATHVVEVALDASQASLAQVGSKVTVQLPDGREVSGTVMTVASSSASSGSPSGTSLSSSASGGSGGDATDGSSGSSGGTGADAPAAGIEVTVTLADTKAVARYTTASVDVLFTSESRADVLAVPVTALVARVGGGYAVEVPKAKAHSTLVPVTVGLVGDDGYAEISGQSVRAGMKALVPK